MGDYEHGHAFSCEVLHNAQHFADELGVEGGRRFVEKHKLRIHSHRTSDGHALLLAAGELYRVVIGLGRQANVLQQLHSAGAGGLFRNLFHLHRCLDDVFNHRAVGEEVERLKDHSDIGALFCGFLLADLIQGAVLFAVANQLAVDVEAARRCLIKVVDAAQEGGLAGARGA